MFRFFFLLLIPLCVIGQPMPHFHGIAQDGHGERAHVHVGHAHGHSHSHGGHRHSHPQPKGPVIDGLPEHDADALFLGGFLSHQSVKKVQPPQPLLAVSLAPILVIPLAIPLSRSGSFFEPPDPSGGLSEYLQTASIRV